MTMTREEALTIVASIVREHSRECREPKPCQDCELEAEAIAALSGAAWRPIAEAPRDGTPILVWPATWTNKAASIAKYNLDQYAKKPGPYWDRDDDMRQVTTSRNKPPTHWMPLPAPPEAKP